MGGTYVNWGFRGGED